SPRPSRWRSPDPVSRLRKHVLTVAAGDPATLAAWLVSRLAVTADGAAQLVARGAVTVDGVRSDGSARLRPGARVVVRRPDESPAISPPATVIYADDAILAVAKPAGMLSQPSVGESGTALSEQIAVAHPSARLVHRIDRAASGLVLFALTP